MLAASAVLLVSFVLIQMRSKNPLLPLRIVLDRGRGGAYLAMGLAGAGMFGVFLFLTFYLQNTLGFSPIQSGLAFLPMSAAIIATATTATTRLVPRVGPKPLVMTGMTLRRRRDGVLRPAAGRLHLRGAHPPRPACCSASASASCSPRPSAARPSASPTATRASPRRWSTPASRSAARSAPRCSPRWPAAPSRATPSTHGTSQAAIAAAAVHGYTTAFYWSAAIFALGAIVSSLVFRGGVPQTAAAPAGEPVLAH